MSGARARAAGLSHMWGRSSVSVLRAPAHNVNGIATSIRSARRILRRNPTNNMQLGLLGVTDEQIAAMRREIDRRKLRDVTDEHLRAYAERALGDTQLAIEAITSVCLGLTHVALRDLER